MTDTRNAAEWRKLVDEANQTAIWIIDNAPFEELARWNAAHYRASMRRYRRMLALERAMILESLNHD